jgi:hypothetical protein
VPAGGRRAGRGGGPRGGGSSLGGRRMSTRAPLRPAGLPETAPPRAVGAWSRGVGQWGRTAVEATLDNGARAAAHGLDPGVRRRHGTHLRPPTISRCQHRLYVIYGDYYRDL